MFQQFILWSLNLKIRFLFFLYFRLTGNLEGSNTPGSLCTVGSWCIDLASTLMFHPFLILYPITFHHFHLNLRKLHHAWEIYVLPSITQSSSATLGNHCTTDAFLNASFTTCLWVCQYQLATTHCTEKYNIHTP